MVKYNDTLFLLVEVSNSEKTFQQQVSYCYLGIYSFIFSKTLRQPNRMWLLTHTHIPQYTLILALSAELHCIILDPPFLPLLIYQQRTPMVGFRGQSKESPHQLQTHTSKTHTHTQKNPTYIHTHTPIKYWSALCFLRSLRLFHCQHHTASTWRLRETS